MNTITRVKAAKSVTRILLLGLALASGVAVADPGLSYEEGIARDPQGKTELYREQHFLRSDGERPLERLVLYRCPGGALFARKRIDYHGSRLAPSFLLDDRRSGYREGMRASPAGAELFFRLRAGAAEQSAPVALSGLVADAGFDQFIHRQWLTLLAGKALPLQFAVPSRLRSMSFSVRRAGSARIAGEAAWVFSLRLDGWLGLVAPSIEVSYSQRSRHLLRFQGLGNLRDDRDEHPLQVRIDFPSAASPASEAQWQAALQAPLTACTTGQ